MIGALGINIKLLYTLVFGLGAALAGARRADAGADPHGADRDGREHPDPRLCRHRDRGIGSIRGAFVAAILVGLIDTLAAPFCPTCCGRS